MVGLTLASLRLVVPGEPFGCPECPVYHCLLYTFLVPERPYP